MKIEWMMIGNQASSGVCRYKYAVVLGVEKQEVEQLGTMVMDLMIGQRMVVMIAEWMMMMIERSTVMLVKEK